MSVGRLGIFLDTASPGYGILGTALWCYPFPTHLTF